jgi:hypothetical protein
VSIHIVETLNLICTLKYATLGGNTGMDYMIAEEQETKENGKTPRRRH